MVVEQHPAPDFTFLVLIARAKLAGLFGQVFEDQRGLGERLASVLQHRHLALLVHVIAPGLLAGLAVEEVDEHRLPGLAGEFEHEGDFVGITGFCEAVKFVFGHGRPSVSFE
ncbi:hypothetical protein D3C79_942610 [compost metagenome]